MKSGILEVQQRGNLADSDPRLHTQVAGRGEVGKSGRPGVYEIVHKISLLSTRQSKGIH